MVDLAEAKVSSSRLDQQPVEEADIQQQSEDKQPSKDWHSLFYSLLKVELVSFGDISELKREVTLGALPPRADFLFKLEDLSADLGLTIFRDLRKLNIFEFKSPGDDLGKAELWQTIIYLAARLRDAILAGEASEDDFTITLFREGKPENLFKELGSCVRADDVAGFYHIENWTVRIPITVVVYGQLKGDEYAGFRAISKHPRIEDITIMAEKRATITDPVALAALNEYFDFLYKVDAKTVGEALRRFPELAATLREALGVDQEIDRAVDAAVATTRRNDLYNYVQDGDMKPDRAAKRLGKTVEAFMADMTAAGYIVPAT